VLYEMLAGEPPFTGPTAQAVLTRHMTEPPRSISALRGSVSPAVEQVVRTALAKVPADRYQSAGEMLRALLAVMGGTGDVPVTLAGERPRGWLDRLRRRWPIGLLIVAALTAGGVALTRPWVAGPRLDSSLLMVAPFAHRAGAMSEGLSGDLCESLLHRALIRWDGLRVVDPLWVADARARHGYDTVRLQHALALARERGAGRLATGEVFAHGDSLFVFAGLYDVGSGGELIREATAALAGDLHDASGRFADLARSLVAGSPAAGAEAGDADGTRSLTAWRAFHDGMLAFNAWDLQRARDRFSAAAAADPAYPQPRLWAAHAQWIAGADDSAWTADVREAVLFGAKLTPADRARARGLNALGAGRYMDACTEFAALTVRDSLDFLAWFGLGECRQRDRLTVRDPASPSGWRFRSSPQAAVAAYERALAVVPSSHRLFRGKALARLAELFPTERTTFRLGYAVATDTVRFGAWPGLSADTLVMVPHPLDRLLAGGSGTVPPSHARAIAHGRELQRAVAARWAAAFPQSADAREALARAYEALGSIGEAGGAEHALGEVRAARGLADDPVQRVRLAAAEIRLLVKRAHLAEARRLADSLLGTPPTSEGEAAELLAPVAALVGRASYAADLAGRAPPVAAFASDGTLIHAPPAVASAAAEFVTHAALNTEAGTVRALHATASRLISRYLTVAEQQRAREAYLGRGEDFAFIDGTLEPSGPGSEAAYLRQLTWQLVEGDTAGVRKRLIEVTGSRSGLPGEVTVDGLYLEARLLAAAGDTGRAGDDLDAVLEALPAQGTELLADAPAAASLVRAMELRARLAAAAGDVPTGRRWAAAVVELWGGADAALQPVVTDMRALSK
jgi:tetratricopeptide (TPR) repeat protein